MAIHDITCPDNFPAHLRHYWQGPDMRDLAFFKPREVTVRQYNESQGAFTPFESVAQILDVAWEIAHKRLNPDDRRWAAYMAHRNEAPPFVREDDDWLTERFPLRETRRAIVNAITKDFDDRHAVTHPQKPVYEWAWTVAATQVADAEIRAEWVARFGLPRATQRWVDAGRPDVPADGEPDTRPAPPVEVLDVPSDVKVDPWAKTKVAS